MPQPEHPPAAAPDPAADAPPILGSWRNVYLFVLGLHVVLLLFFYLISRAYA